MMMLMIELFFILEAWLPGPYSSEEVPWPPFCILQPVDPTHSKKRSSFISFNNLKTHTTFWSGWRDLPVIVQRVQVSWRNENQCSIGAEPAHHLLVIHTHPSKSWAAPRQSHSIYRPINLRPLSMIPQKHWPWFPYLWGKPIRRPLSRHLSWSATVWGLLTFHRYKPKRARHNFLWWVQKDLAPLDSPVELSFIASSTIFFRICQQLFLAISFCRGWRKWSPQAPGIFHHLSTPIDFCSHI